MIVNTLIEIGDDRQDIRGTGGKVLAFFISEMSKR